MRRSCGCTARRCSRGTGKDKQGATMKGRRTGIGLIVLAFAGSACGAVPSAIANFAPAPAATARVGPTPALGKCINLANTLEPPNEGDWGGAFRDEDAQTIRSAGFSTVRVPVNFLGHA